MEKKQIDTNVGLFLKDVLTGGKNLVKFFEEKKNNLNFEGENANVFQFIVLKSFEIDFHFLMPLSNHLIDNNYCIIDKNMTQYAALNGFKVEEVLKKLKQMQDGVNDTMKDFRFEEKMVITNQPATDIYNLAKKIINNSTQESYENVKAMFESAKFDLNSSELMQRKEIKSSLKV